MVAHLEYGNLNEIQTIHGKVQQGQHIMKLVPHSLLYVIHVKKLAVYLRRFFEY